MKKKTIYDEIVNSMIVGIAKKDIKRGDLVQTKNIIWDNILEWNGKNVIFTINNRK